MSESHDHATITHDSEIVEPHDSTMNEQNDNKIIESSDCEETFCHDITKLWNKKDYFYKIDNATEGKIIKNFELKLKNKDIQVEDAFYSSSNIIPVAEISQLKDDSYIKKNLECRELRELNFEFLILCNKNIKEIQDYIEIYRLCTDEDEKLILRNIILQKKRQDILYNSVRNYISDLIIKAEDCYIFIDSVWSTVFRKSLELVTTDLSSQECN
ncbi:hypothetical protein AAJ76_3200036966 [Vairimorpha ceranae]|uniref:Uncharacterized protein n=1 Tax=Vairimorpha ceranae TaxID=40302 RepID=A0A0F9WC73_9MICR|nr:hypothetical protein AAJ76_3200036966 [Vairimorpha ceranae]KAF5141092.1 hypothetical protein G9O61_00g007830 [Vairimorpha ceranae]KKO75116.1 hypothetical protein AAJ76_3200036966 [Vairimorpha ceranae]